MREILFRGKPNNAIMEDDFIYGLLVKQVDLDGKDVLCIQTWERDDEGVSSRVLEVIPSTVGEFTGLTDKNGTKIFEGDILKNEKGICFGGEYKACVEYSDVFGKYCAVSDCVEFEANDFDYLEVIGNTFDNPELLKGGEGE